MLNIAETLHRWCREARPFALATIVHVSGSAPLPPGTALAVNADGDAVGSISGGCVEGAVYELCQQVLGDRGAPARAQFGYSDSDAFAVGLTCGGKIDVLVQCVEPASQRHLTAALDAVVRGRSAAVAQVVDGPAELLGNTLYIADNTGSYSGALGGDRANQAVAIRARALLRAGRTGRIEIGGDADTCPERLSVLVHTNAPRPRMLIFGAVGVSESRLAHLHFPIGLDLGAHTPEETAVSITAEIIAHANHGTGLPLSGSTGPIHHPITETRPTAASTAA
jgi:xanthine dehydrogenase accessory factor